FRTARTSPLPITAAAVTPPLPARYANATLPRIWNIAVDLLLKVKNPLLVAWGGDRSAGWRERPSDEAPHALLAVGDQRAGEGRHAAAEPAGRHHQVRRRQPGAHARGGEDSDPRGEAQWPPARPVGHEHPAHAGQPGRGPLQQAAEEATVLDQRCALLLNGRC